MALQQENSVCWILILIIWYSFNTYISAQEVVINEVMPANSVTISDEDSEFSDWIELYWQTIIDWGDEWKYLVPIQEPPSDWNTLAFNDQGADNYDHEALIYRGLPAESFTIDSLHNLISEGENVLAIQVHNHSIGSSDLTAIPFLSIGSKTRPATTNPVPPVLHINSPLLHTNFRLDAEGETVYLYDPSGIIVDSIAFERMYTDLSSGRYPDGSGSLFYFQEATPGEPNLTKTYSSISGEPYFSVPGGLFSTTLSVYLTGMEPDDTIYFTIDGSEPTIYSQKYTGGIPMLSTTVLRARILEHGKIPGHVVSHTYLINIQNAGMKIFGGWSRGFPQKSLSLFARSQYGYTGKFRSPQYNIPSGKGEKSHPDTEREY